MQKKFIVNNKEYTVLKLLGHGKSGYSYKVIDKQNKIYTLKKIHHEPCEYYKFGDKFRSELDDYDTLKDFVLMPKIYDFDANQEIIIKEFIDGINISEMIERKDNIDIQVTLIKQIAKVCYKHGINIDYYPTNFIYFNEKLYYVDYECNKYMKEWDFENWGIKHWSINSHQ